MSRILLISPAFHSYWRSLEGALQRRGHEVSTLRYDEYATVPEKLRLKATVELPERLHLPGEPRARERRRVTDHVISQMRAYHPDVVVIVKGDLLEDRFWDALGSTPRFLWMYDELHRHEYTMDLLREIGPLGTYSLPESELLKDSGAQAVYMPCAFDPHRVPLTEHREHHVAFVGAGYPNRRRILTQLAAAGVPVHAWGRDFSRHPIDRLRTFSWKRPPIESSRDIPLERAYQVMGEAAAAVNIHGEQTGLSMRSFEIPGMAGVQLTDRPDVSHLYEVGSEVAVWESTEELIELSQRALSDTAWAQSLRDAGRKRTLAEHTFDHRVATMEELWA